MGYATLGLAPDFDGTTESYALSLRKSGSIAVFIPGSRGHSTDVAARQPLSWHIVPQMHDGIRAADLRTFD